MEKCIQSVLAGGEDVEVIIVDDGSTKDETAKLQMNMQQNIRRLLRRFIRRTVDMDRQLIQDWHMQRVNILKWLTVMTGWI